MNSGGYLLSCEAARLTTFIDTEVYCFSIYHTSWITSGPKRNSICDNTPTKAILFFFGCLEVNSTWLITSELANQHTRKVLFTCVVYTKHGYMTAFFVSSFSVVTDFEYTLDARGLLARQQRGASERVVLVDVLVTTRLRSFATKFAHWEKNLWHPGYIEYCLVEQHEFKAWNLLNFPYIFFSRKVNEHSQKDGFSAQNFACEMKVPLVFPTEKYFSASWNWPKMLLNCK